eukprot:g7398.t1
MADMETADQHAQRQADQERAAIHQNEIGEHGSANDTAPREPVDFKLRVSDTQVAQGASNITITSTDEPFFNTRLDAMADEAPRTWPTHHHAPIHGSASTLPPLIPQEVRPAITLNEALMYLRDTIANTSAPDRVIVAMSAALHDLLTNLRTAQDNRHTDDKPWDTHQNSRGVWVTVRRSGTGNKQQANSSTQRAGAASTSSNRRSGGSATAFYRAHNSRHQEGGTVRKTGSRDNRRGQSHSWEHGSSTTSHHGRNKDNRGSHRTSHRRDNGYSTASSSRTSNSVFSAHPPAKSRKASRQEQKPANQEERSRRRSRNKGAASSDSDGTRDSSVSNTSADSDATVRHASKLSKSSLRQSTSGSKKEHGDSTPSPTCSNS